LQKKNRAKKRHIKVLFHKNGKILNKRRQLYYYTPSFLKAEYELMKEVKGKIASTLNFYVCLGMGFELRASHLQSRHSTA
jgi:hypothetical protein